MNILGLFYLIMNLKKGYVITGGPGAGKTALVDALHEKEYFTFDETAKELIEKSPIKNFHLNYPARFLKETLDKYISNYNSAKKLDICFFDRGIPDVLAMIDIVPYLSPRKHISYKRALEASKKYRYGKIFLLEPLPNYDPKKHVNLPKEHSLIFHRFTVNRYKQLGYELIHIPACPVKDRTDMILNHIE